MDNPDANLQEQIELAQAIVDGKSMIADETRLAELVLALDEWLTHKGFPPERWMR